MINLKQLYLTHGGTLIDATIPEQSGPGIKWQ